MSSTIGYRVATQADGSKVVYRQSDDGTRQAVNRLPPDAVRGRFGGSVRVSYAPEPPAQFNPLQFGVGRYYDPGFYMCVDLAGEYSIAQQKSYGVNLFSPWTLPEINRGQLVRGDGFGYLTERQCFGDATGRGIYEMTLYDYYRFIYDRVPILGQAADTFFSKCTLAAFNIEASGFWGRAYYVSDWDQKKSTQIVCEFDGQTRTLEQIDQQGLWDIEYGRRFANRMVLLMKIAREKAASDIKMMWGSSMHQYYPKVEQRGVQSSFQNSSCDVSHVLGGDSSGNITLVGPRGDAKTYKLTGSVWDQEDVMHGYYYWFNFDIAQQDYQDIWVDHKAGTQTYPYVWSKIQPMHIVADEKGYLQQNREQMRLNQGKTRPIIRLSAMSYEGEAAGLVNGVETIHRAPFANLQNVYYNETPKVWQPPYMFYSRYMVTRFFAGAEPGWGFHVFPPTTDMVFGSLANMPIYQHHMHTYTACFQARADMQPLERWYLGSTLLEDPDVLIDGTWQNYDGALAFNIEGGAHRPQKPAFMLRHKRTPSGWTVWVLGGAPQGYTSESTWQIRVPSGGLNGNRFQVKLRGAGAQLFEFTVDGADTNQLYTGSLTVDSAYERPGYSGRTVA